MKFEYFDVTDIFKTRYELEKTGECLETYDESGFSLRWLQSPLAAYFLCTEDEYGNMNVAGSSLGTAVWGEHPHGRWFYVFAVQNSRQSMRNIDINKECVISYIPKSLLRESAITSFPLPYGISELEVAKMTPLPSKKVKPCGIAECVSNLEAKVINQVQVANTTIFIAEIVGMSVQKKAIKKDKEKKYQPGIGGTDLLYEISINGNPPRLNYAMMDIDHIFPSPNDIGDGNQWIGTFESWMKSEYKRGKIDRIEYEKIMKLNDKWLRNTNPESNGEVRQELTDMLTRIVWMNKK